MIAVTGGPEFTFSDVAIVNQAPPTSDPDDQVELPVMRGYGAGQVARSTVILAAETLALEAWRQQGIPRLKSCRATWSPIMRRRR